MDKSCARMPRFYNMCWTSFAPRLVPLLRIRPWLSRAKGVKYGCLTNFTSEAVTESTEEPQRPTQCSTRTGAVSCRRHGTYWGERSATESVLWALFGARTSHHTQYPQWGSLSSWNSYRHYTEGKRLCMKNPISPPASASAL